MPKTTVESDFLESATADVAFFFRLTGLVQIDVSVDGAVTMAIGDLDGSNDALLDAFRIHLAS